ncbi:30S ribosomal protein S8e [Candidatus Bathyarchaeota archaeon]|nr:30S ribosomal protein S8e [Candidatus Bathyarchaeota archaeon]
MSVWHGDLEKRKPTGGKKRAYRKKRKFEMGSFPTETLLGEEKRKVDRVRGGNVKVRLLSTEVVNLSDPKTGRTERTKILRVLENPANIDYDRRGVLTKGTIVETPLGKAKITSRPGQNGVVNAVLLH